MWLPDENSPFLVDSKVRYQTIETADPGIWNQGRWRLVHSRCFLLSLFPSLRFLCFPFFLLFLDYKIHTVTDAVQVDVFGQTTTATSKLHCVPQGRCATRRELAFGPGFTQCPAAAVVKSYSLSPTRPRFVPLGQQVKWYRMLSPGRTIEVFSGHSAPPHTHTHSITTESTLSTIKRFLFIFN